MADDGDDDYFSDKFLTPVEPQNSKTYSEKRKEALRESLRRDEQNRTKSRRQLEHESREDGLSKTLFERAEEDKSSGRGPENKALSMMMNMGFKPGQALGVPARVDEGTTPNHTSREAHEGRLVNPLPLNEWSGTSNIYIFRRQHGTAHE
jgi:G-patch domain